VSVNVLSTDIFAPIEKICSVVHVDVGTCHPSMYGIPVLSSHSVHTHISISDRDGANSTLMKAVYRDGKMLGYSW